MEQKNRKIGNIENRMKTSKMPSKWESGLVAYIYCSGPIATKSGGVEIYGNEADLMLVRVRYS